MSNQNVYTARYNWEKNVFDFDIGSSSFRYGHNTALCGWFVCIITVTKNIFPYMMISSHYMFWIIFVFAMAYRHFTVQNFANSEFSTWALDCKQFLVKSVVQVIHHVTDGFFLLKRVSDQMEYLWGKHYSSLFQKKVL